MINVSLDFWLNSGRVKLIAGWCVKRICSSTGQWWSHASVCTWLPAPSRRWSTASTANTRSGKCGIIPEHLLFLALPLSPQIRHRSWSIWLPTHPDLCCRESHLHLRDQLIRSSSPRASKESERVTAGGLASESAMTGHEVPTLRSSCKRLVSYDVALHLADSSIRRSLSAPCRPTTTLFFILRSTLIGLMTTTTPTLSKRQHYPKPSLTIPPMPISLLTIKRQTSLLLMALLAIWTSHLITAVTVCSTPVSKSTRALTLPSVDSSGGITSTWQVKIKKKINF